MGTGNADVRGLIGCVFCTGPANTVFETPRKRLAVCCECLGEMRMRMRRVDGDTYYILVNAKAAGHEETIARFPNLRRAGLYTLQVQNWINSLWFEQDSVIDGTVPILGEE